MLLESILLGLLGLLPRCICQELQCVQHQNAPLCNGDFVTSTCSIQSSVLLWIIETAGNDYEIDFNARNVIGDRESSGMFSANLTKHYPDPSTDVSESILQFTFSEKLNGSTVICPNLFNETLTKSCVIANNEALPGHVKDVNTDHASCINASVSWNEPDNIGPSNIDHYLVALEPPTNGIQEYHVPITQFVFTNLEYGINYNLSISACNCITCGPIVTISVAMDLTKEELMQRLMIDSSSISYTVVQGVSGYEIRFEWRVLLPSCALSYSVNISFMDSTHMFNTIHTNYSSDSPHFTKGSRFNVSVAGVNGKVTGPYSPDLCIEIEVPSNVMVITKEITREGFGYFLEIMWKPQRNACTRPKVDHYIVNYNRQSFTVNDTSLSMNLPSTINTGGNLSVGIIAVNAVGMGNPATIISVPFPNSAITQTQPTVLILVIIGLLLTILSNT